MTKTIAKLKSSGRVYIGDVYAGMTQKQIDFNRENGKTYHSRPSEGQFYGRILKEGKGFGRVFMFYIDELELQNNS